MPLYVVSFAEHGGYRCQCRIRAAAVADHVALAVKKTWGDAYYWVGSQTEGRVYERLGDEAQPVDRPRTGRCTVQITPAQRRPRVAHAAPSPGR